MAQKTYTIGRTHYVTGSVFKEGERRTMEEEDARPLVADGTLVDPEAPEGEAPPPDGGDAGAAAKRTRKASA